jgi:co-chaperonin GroES (HSP10)
MSNERKVAKNVIGFKPAGSYIVVELLEDKEVLGTGLTLSGNTKLEAPQAYVLGMGPSLDTSRFGVGVGDRVIISGGFVPLPRREGQRQAGVIDVNSVKAVLVEGDEVACGTSLITNATPGLLLGT